MNDTSVSATGDTVAEAKWAAVRQLEQLVPLLDRASVRFEVVNEGTRGTMGIGFVAAEVIASVARAGRQSPNEGTAIGDEESAHELVRRACAAIGIAGSVSMRSTDSDITIDVATDQAGLLIGRRGQTIDAVQYLANTLSYRVGGSGCRQVVIDVEGYRRRRNEELRALACRSADLVAESDVPVVLEPMSAVERKVVHEALKDDDRVATSSAGREPDRHVLVTPRPR